MCHARMARAGDAVLTTKHSVYPDGMAQKSSVSPSPKPMIDPYEVPNRLLGALEPESRMRIAPHIEPVALKLGDVVCKAGGFLEHVYFPMGAVLSLLTSLKNGTNVETANIGNEGAFGLLRGMYSRTSFNQCLVQLAKVALVRVPIDCDARVRAERSTCATSW